MWLVPLCLQRDAQQNALFGFAIAAPGRLIKREPPKKVGSKFLRFKLLGGARAMKPSLGGAPKRKWGVRKGKAVHVTGGVSHVDKAIISRLFYNMPGAVFLLAKYLKFSFSRWSFRSLAKSMYFLFLLAHEIYTLSARIQKCVLQKLAVNC